MVKVLYLPLNFGDKVFSGVYDAFREAGCELEVFDYYYYYTQNRNNKNIRNMFVQKVQAFQPDLIHMQIQHTTVIDADAVRRAKEACPKAKITNFTIDVRAFVQPQYHSVSRFSDYNLICSTGQLEMYKRAGIQNVLFWQVGYDPKMYFSEEKPKESYEFDIVFSGNFNAKENYPGHHERVQAMYVLKRNLGDRFGLFGSGWPKDLQCNGSIEQNRIVIDAYHKSFSVLSISHFNQIDHYFSDRLLMCLASGRPTISWHFPRYQSYFLDNCDLVIAETADEIVNKVHYLLNNKDEANYIGINGAAKAFSEHTYLSRVNELLDIVGLK